jgi:DNA repair photolyase
MIANTEFQLRLARFQEKTLFPRLSDGEQRFVRELASQYRFTFQEFRQVVEICRDLSMWRQGSLEAWWRNYSNLDNPLSGAQAKKSMLQQLQQHVGQLKGQEKIYSRTAPLTPVRKPALKIYSQRSDKKIHGMCPVVSEKTVCCNLHTIDAVQNCMYGCSYCSIQTFYQDQITFDEDLASKLNDITLEPDRFYHFGTGQASDSLVWGNRNGNLDALCQFAKDHPNVLLEFKTKSDNIGYFLDHDIPGNVVCSWSLNTPSVIENEEHLTVSLERRIVAARQLADAGIKVAFHFHPMVYYRGWDKDYPQIADSLLAQFAADEVLFISFGSVTLIKPVIKKIREQGNPSRILQMDFVSDPHGKLTYPDETKVLMFRTMYDSFSPWHDKVLIYLCMEKTEIWQQVFGFVYASNRQFERDFAKKTLFKEAPI